jgi:hypothetical protein
MRLARVSIGKGALMLNVLRNRYVQTIIVIILTLTSPLWFPFPISQ